MIKKWVFWFIDVVFAWFRSKLDSADTTQHQATSMAESLQEQQSVAEQHGDIDEEGSGVSDDGHGGISFRGMRSS